MKTRYAGALLISAAVFTMSGIAHAGDLVTGLVIDSETKRPIGGALVRLVTRVSCERPPLSQRFAREAVTGTDGRFSLSADLSESPCAGGGRSQVLEVVGPGYLSDVVIKPGEAPELVERSPIRDLRLPDEHRRLLASEADSRRAAAAASERAPSAVAPAWRSGVFVSRDGAAFDRVATLERTEVGYRIVIAQDRNTGAFYGWTPDGAVAPVPSLLSEAPPLDPRHPQAGLLPFLDTTTRLPLIEGGFQPRSMAATPWPMGARVVFVRDPNDWRQVIVAASADGRELVVHDVIRWRDAVGPQPRAKTEWAFPPVMRLDVTDVLLGTEGRIECMTRLDTSDPTIALFVRTDWGREVHVLRPYQSDPEDWRVDPTRTLSGALDGEVTACAGGRGTAYAAVRDRGLVKVTLRSVSVRGGLRWSATIGAPVTVAPGPATFRALAVGHVDRAREVVYAVTGASVLYRFGADLTPDQQAE